MYSYLFSVYLYDTENKRNVSCANKRQMEMDMEYLTSNILDSEAGGVIYLLVCFPCVSRRQEKKNKCSSFKIIRVTVSRFLCLEYFFPQVVNFPPECRTQGMMIV